MRQTVHDVGMKLIIESQLKAGGLSVLDLRPFKDITVGEHSLAVYTGCICKSSEDCNQVMDIWLVSACGFSRYYNQVNYPTPEEAVAQQLGQLAMEGLVKVVDTVNAPRKRRSRKRTDV